MVQMRWIDKVFSFFKLSPESSLKNEYWDALSSSKKGGKGRKISIKLLQKRIRLSFCR